MNKLLTKIAKVVLGLSLAAGVGVAVGTGAKKASSVEAASPVNITLSTTGCTATGYDSGQERTWTQDGTSFGAVYLMKSGSNMQFQKANAKVYNKTAMGGTITAINLTVGSGTARSWQLKLGTTRANVAAVSGYNASSTGWSSISGSYTFFEIYNPSGGASYLSQIQVTYAAGGQTTQVITGSSTGEVGTPVSLSTNASSTTWSLTNNTAGATLSTTTGKTTSVSATQAGSVTVNAAAVTGYTSATHTITFSEPFASQEFELIKSDSALVAGGEYVIGGSGSNSGYFISTNQASNNRTATTGTVTNEKVSSTADMQVITLGGSSGAWQLKVDSTHYLYTGSTTANRLQTTTTLSDNARWDISVTSQGLATIHNVGNTSRGQMNFNENSGSPIFNCYATGGNLCIYKLRVTTPTLTITPEIDMTLGDAVPSITVEAENFSGTPTYAWTSSDTSVATISGTTASPTITILAAGETTLEATATYNSQTASSTCVLTVHAVPTEVQVMVNSAVATSETVLSNYEGRTRQPTVHILPASASQEYSLTVLSETVTGAFTINNHTINYVKPATGVIRFTAIAKTSVYFDLNVECEENTPVDDTFAYSGDVATQYEGAQFNPDGLSFTINKIANPSTPVSVDLSEITFSPSVLESSTTSVTATHSSGQTVNIPVTVSALVTTPIADFYNGTIDVSSVTASTYTFKGTCICIIGNNFYLQEGDYGIYVYAGNSSTTGLEVGKLVLVEAKITTYNGLVETSSGSIVSKQVLGNGTLPAGQIVSTFSAFSALNQSIYASFNGLRINNDSTSYTSIHWTKNWSGSGTTSDGIATVYDSTGAAVTLYVSKYIANGAAVVAALNAIGADETFDITNGVVALNNNVKQLSLMTAGQIVVHAAGEDLIVSWANTYLYMQDASFNGQGTGLCKTNNLYITAKRALIALGSSLVSDFQNNNGSKYTAALARYTAWASACGDTSPFAGNDIVPAQSQAVLANIVGKNTNSITVIVIVSLVAVAAIGGYFFIKRRQEN